MSITCIPVQRMRLPRGRHVHTLRAENRELRDKLEQLNETLENRGPEQSADGSSMYSIDLHTGNQPYDQTLISDHMQATMTTESVSSPTNLTTSDPPQDYLAKDFWNNTCLKVSS